MTEPAFARPLALKHETLPNRLAKAAMTEGLADTAGRATPELTRLYETWARGGAGLLITGNVVMDPHHLERPGNVIIAGRKSPFSLYREDFATFGQEDVYDQSDAEGFIKLFSLPVKVRAMMDVAEQGQSRYAEPDYSVFKRD